MAKRFVGIDKRRATALDSHTRRVSFGRFVFNRVEDAKNVFYASHRILTKHRARLLNCSSCQIQTSARSRRQCNISRVGVESLEKCIGVKIEISGWIYGVISLVDVKWDEMCVSSTWPTSALLAPTYLDFESRKDGTKITSRAGIGPCGTNLLDIDTLPFLQSVIDMSVFSVVWIPPIL